MKSNYSQCLTNCRAVILQILNEQMNIYCLRLWKEPVVRGEREWNVRCFFSTHYTPELSSEEWFIIWNLWWCGGVLFSWYTSYFIVVTLKHSKIWDWMLISLRPHLLCPKIQSPVGWFMEFSFHLNYIAESSIESALNPSLSISHVWKHHRRSLSGVLDPSI